MKRVISGIQATGDLTIGNYIGAINNLVKMQDEYELLVFVADLHTLTIDIDPKEFRSNRNKIMALYLACGLDPKKTTLFFQSEVSEHTYISWIMENRTTIGELERMTQFKDKAAKNKLGNGTVKVKTGLLTYPALMAGDILLYDADEVVVGQDQKQHLELARNIAERFNNQYGQTFVVPNPHISKIGSKIMSLSDPSKKMSKSDEKKNSFITLLDSEEDIRKKISKAVTDSEGKVYLSDDKPGVKNLLTIYASFEGITLEEAENSLKDMNYGEFKTAVADTVVTKLMNIQSKYEAALEQINAVAKDGAVKARAIASKKIEDIKSKIGL